MNHFTNLSALITEQVQARNYNYARQMIQTLEIIFPYRKEEIKQLESKLNIRELSQIVNSN